MVVMELLGKILKFNSHPLKTKFRFHSDIISPKNPSRMNPSTISRGCFNTTRVRVVCTYLVRVSAVPRVLSTETQTCLPTRVHHTFQGWPCTVPERKTDRKNGHHEGATESSHAYFGELFSSVVMRGVQKTNDL